jgi:phosphohistidine phosphatase SixA
VRDAAADHGTRTVVVVGHQPDCGRAAAALGDGAEPAFPPCGHHAVDL